MTLDVDTTARRIALAHELYARADERTRAVDPSLQPQTPRAWMRALHASLHALGGCASLEEGRDALVELGADVLRAVEWLDGEMRA